MSRLLLIFNLPFSCKRRIRRSIPIEKPTAIEFYVTKPFDKEKATNGNGTQVSFVTESRHMVDNFHKTGLKAGGKSEGSGGERPPNSGVYYSYIRDLDGNKICAFTNNKT